jgi:hypothetical protein
VTAPVGPLFRLTEDFGRGTAFPFAADRGEQVVVDLGPLLDEVLSAARARRAEGPGGVRAVVVRLEVDPEGVLAVASAARGRSN